MRNELVASYIIELPEDVELLDRKLNDFFKKQLQEEEIAFASIKDEITRLSSYGINPQDLSPDKITNLAVTAKNELKKEEIDKSSLGVSASASFLGIGGSAAVNTTRESLKKSMEDKGWTFGEGGETWLPKSLKVYAVNTNVSKNEGMIDFTVSRRQRGTPTMGMILNTRRLASPPEAVLLTAIQEQASLLKQFMKREWITVVENQPIAILMREAAGKNLFSKDVDFTPASSESNVLILVDIRPSFRTGVAQS